MNTAQPFYLFSAERSELGLQENGGRTQFVGEWLRRENIPFTIVKGRWRCTEERAFIVPVPEDRHKELFDAVKRITGLYEQETFLLVDANRRAALYSPAGAHLADVGQWQEVTADKAKEAEAITITPDGRYWLAA